MHPRLRTLRRDASTLDRSGRCSSRSRAPPPGRPPATSSTPTSAPPSPPSPAASRLRSPSSSDEPRRGRTADVGPADRATRRILPRPWDVPVRPLAVSRSRTTEPHGALPGDAARPAIRGRHARPHGQPPVRPLPGGDRGGAALLAGRGTGGTGDRGAKLRARDHRLERATRARPSTSRSAPPRRARSTEGSRSRPTPPIDDGSAPSGAPTGRSSSTEAGPRRPSTSRPRTGGRTRTKTSSGAPRSPTCAPSSSATTAPRRRRAGGSDSPSTTSPRSCARRAAGRQDRRSRDAHVRRELARPFAAGGTSRSLDAETSAMP